MHIAARTHSPHLGLADAVQRPLTSRRQHVHGIMCPFSPQCRKQTAAQATRYLWGSSLISITGRDTACRRLQAPSTPAVDRQDGLRQSVQNQGIVAPRHHFLLFSHRSLAYLGLRAWTPCHSEQGCIRSGPFPGPDLLESSFIMPVSHCILDGRS